MKGWIKIDRRLIDNWIYTAEPFDKCHAWIDLLLMASHEPHAFMKHGKMTNLERGQLVVGRQKLGERWGWSENKVNRYLHTLMDQQMVLLNGTPNGTVITIVNYGKYQDWQTANGTSNGTPDGTTDGTTDGTLTIMDKNIKNGEEISGARRKSHRKTQREIEEEEDARMMAEWMAEQEAKERNGNA